MKTALALLTLLTTAAAYAAPSDSLPGAQTCSVEKVAGAYGFSVTGTILPGNLPGLPAGPVVAAGVLYLDAYGQMSGYETINFTGSLASDVKFSGTYQVNPDCTLTLEDPGFFHNFGVSVADGNEMFVINTDPGVIITITAKRLHLK